jgi:Ni,Fe-hydrogenase III large subunit
MSDPRGAVGPVARAAGISEDARAGEREYDALGFEPVVRDGGDALERLRLRLAEAERSLALIEAVDLGAGTAFPGNNWEDASGSGAATVETPRGTASLSLTLQEGEVREAELQLPSEAHLRFVEGLTLQQEVGDALVGVASLDLSPWGLADEEAG